MSKHDVVTTLRKSYEHLVRFIGLFGFSMFKPMAI